MKLNPKSDYLQRTATVRDHIKADEIEFMPATIAGDSLPEEIVAKPLPPSASKKARRAGRKVATDRPISKSTGQPANQSTDRLTDQPTDQSTSQLTDRLTDQPASQLASQSTDRLTDRPTDQSTSQSTDLLTMLSTVQSTDKKTNRPAAFYITERQSAVLDAVVAHLKAAHGVNADRSALLRATLDEPVLNFYDEGTHEDLIKRLVDQLTGRLMGRQPDREANRSEKGNKPGSEPADSRP